MRVLSSILIGLAATHQVIAFAPTPLTYRSQTQISKIAKQQNVATTPTISSSSSSHTTPTIIRTRNTQLYMGWGPDPIWSTAQVESNIQSCPSGSCVSISVNVDDGSDYLVPGQYVQVRPADGKINNYCLSNLLEVGTLQGFVFIKVYRY